MWMGSQCAIKIARQPHQKTAGVLAGSAPIFPSNLSGTCGTPKDTAIPAVASDEWAKKLDDKERRFVEGYLQTLNKREAALYAGWSESTAKRWAYEIFKRPHVREAIEYFCAPVPASRKRGSST